MVELLLAGVIVGAVATAAAVTGVRDRRRRSGRTGPRDAAPTSGEPIPSGWTAGRDGAEH